MFGQTPKTTALSLPLDQQLAALIKESKAEPEIKLKLQEDFAELVQRLGEINTYRERAQELVVTDSSQTELMKDAKAGADYLRETRKALDDVHKKLKARALEEGRLVDGVKRLLLAEIEPLEKHLRAQADFVKLQEKARQEAEEKRRREEEAEADRILREEQAQERQRILKVAQEQAARAQAAEEAENRAKAEIRRKEAELQALEKEAQKQAAKKQAELDAAKKEAEELRQEIASKKICCPNCGHQFTPDESVGGF